MKQISLYRLIIIGLLSVALTSCGLGGGTAQGYNPNGSTDNSSVGDVSAMYVAVANLNSLISHTRTAGSFSSDCSISSTLSTQDLVCIIDVPEGDIYNKGIRLEFNNPAGMCRYTVREPYWYYNQEVGYGPASIDFRKSVNDDGDILAYTCSVDGGAFGACGALLEVDVDTVNDSFTCKYNRTSANGVNCCLGEYTTSMQLTNVDTGEVSTTNGKGEWGGDIKACIGGPGKTNWEKYTKKGFPVGVIEPAGDGLRSIQNTTAPNENPNDGYNIPIANYYTPALHSHDGYFSARISTLPYFIDPIDDRDGTLMPVANAAYTYECLDEAFEIQHRISVYIREWDVYSDYLNYIASSGVTEVPDRPGEDEGTDCDGVDGVCNDIFDIDNFIDTVLAAPYETATPALRRNNFPKNDYSN